ncbi:hypothetical protein CKAH01_01689 [Colletotrichum kahawae]|uniref:Uncharacterized protein n=1 Tax=Colletotrichum kahawae TaxID=34407 RepID=A0AAD9Y484_COLKA|nr:hypothetical protein CKAH01_01689 [Colletotrichum kahawae]
MAPVMSVPQGHSFPNGRVIRPEEMRAVTVNRDTEVIMRDQKGNRIEGDVDKGRIGYLMCDVPDMEGYVLCQLVNNDGELQKVAIRKADVDVGQLHRLQVEKPNGQQWNCYHVIREGREISVFRIRSRVSQAGGRALFKIMVPVTGDTSWNLCYSLDQLDAKPPVGTPLVVSIQSMDDGKPHATPWYRGPHHGAWDNSHELHSFAVTAAWHDETTSKWVSVTVQNSETFSRRNIQLPTDHYHRNVGGDISYNDPWIMATRMLQFIHNRRYQNPPPFLARSLNVDVKDVVWNHMEQAVRFIPRTKFQNAESPKRVTFLKSWNAIQQTWPNLMIGPKPEGFDWKCAPITAGEIEPDEIVGLGATAEQIASWTCQICWTAYRRPCVWIDKDIFTQTRKSTEGSSYVYTLPNYPGLVPVFPSQFQAAELPPALPEYDIYHLKGELDTNEDDAEGDVVDEFAVVG